MHGSCVCVCVCMCVCVCVCLCVCVCECNLSSLEALIMYYVIGASVPSLHRESTDSLI